MIRRIDAGSVLDPIISDHPRSNNDGGKILGISPPVKRRVPTVALGMTGAHYFGSGWSLVLVRRASQKKDFSNPCHPPLVARDTLGPGST